MSNRAIKSRWNFDVTYLSQRKIVKMVMSCSINLADSNILVLYIFCCFQSIFEQIYVHVKHVDLQCEIVLYFYSVCTYSS